MSVSWKDVAGAVGKAAPVLGTALGGPVGGAAGALVASLFGVEAEPEKVEKAIAADPEAMIKLRRLEMEHVAELRRMTIEAETTRLSEVNKTMRAEAQSDKWWVSGWRPFWGFTTALAFFGQVGGIVYLMVTGGDAELIAALGNLSIFWSVPLAILGVSAWHRGKEKRMRAGERPEHGLMGAVADRLKSS